MAQSINRRTFLKALLGVGGAALLANWGLHIPFVKKTPAGRLLGPSVGLGHQLRDGQLSLDPSHTIETDAAIIGGGVAGLSAAWWLKKQGFDNFLLLEMEKAVGGNSRCGKNAVTGYPWGAHYVPIPNPDAHYVRMLFEELGVISGYDGQQRPIYNELYLCHDPQERLFKDGQWQEGLVPLRGARESDHIDLKRFFARIKAYKTSIGQDGKRAFSIPLDESSRDEKFLALDKISMAEWLKRENFQSRLLYWYVTYCCRDDYGATPDKVSAWAGIHYFAARDGLAANAEPQAVLTWPEGNGWLVSRLQEKLLKHIRTGSAAYQIEDQNTHVHVKVMDAATQKAYTIKAKKVIFAGPRFIAKHLIKNLPAQPEQLTYSPWLVANITLSHLPQGEGISLAWDNVGYYDQSLGYVVATHQNISVYPTKTVITYYRPLDHEEPKKARKEAFSKTYSDWVEMILTDLKTMHHDIESYIENIDTWVWGHGMIRPSVGYLWGAERQAMLKPLGKIYFAHSDMSGISIFEEAQYRGVIAAKSVLEQLKA